MPGYLHRHLMHLGIILIALICAVGLVAPAESRAQEQGELQIGVLDNAYALTYPDRFWQDVHDLNITWVRFDVRWDQIAAVRPLDPESPVDPAYRWEQADAFLARAEREGFGGRVLFTVWGSPPWAADPVYLRDAPADKLAPEEGSEQWEAGMDRIPRGINWMPRQEHWRAFITALGSRYSGRLDLDGPGRHAPLPRVDWWEIWNEPNYIGALRPQSTPSGEPLAPKLYASLYEVAQSRLRELHPQPELTVAAGALYRSGPRSARRGSTHPRLMLEALARSDAPVEVISYHPYNCNPHAGIADGRRARDRAGYCYTLANIDDFAALVDRLFSPARPRLWITEFGLQTDYPNNIEEVNAVSEAAQARYIFDAFALLREHPRIERSAWFLLKDDPVERKSATWQSGVRRTIDTDYAPKAGYWAWRQAVSP